jgi:hypothetical protein
MAKVVGVDQSLKRLVSCWSCASIIEYAQNEVEEYKHNQDYLGGFDVSRGIKCPSCGKMVNTDKK